MYLKSLTLKGFKSFADRTVMRFEPGVAAVVGPNGSGKSNISDAVLWVLGERNAKNLRGQSMEDVIFSGSSARKPVSVAEVELLLDNSDGTLPVDFAEVSIGRRMYRSGESEYLINGTIVRRMDVLDVLHDSGLGTGTNSIISQGNLDSVLSSKPEDRRALIEEAAGILKHKERKAKSERKLAQMDNHLARVNDIASEVERQLKPLERKAKKAQSYQKLSAELAEIRLDLAVSDIRLLQDRWNEAIAQEADLSQQDAAVRQRLEAVEAYLDDLQQHLQQRDSTSQGMQRSVQRVQTLCERLSSTALLFSEKSSGYQAEAARLEQSLEQGRQRASSAEQELVQARSALQDARVAHSAANKRSAELEKQYRECVGRRKDLRRSLDTLSAQQRSFIHKQETIQASQDALRNNLADKRARATVISSQIEDTTQRLATAKQRLDAAEQQAQEFEGRMQELSAQELSARDARNRLTAQRAQARDALDTARSALTQATAERSALEELERASESSNPILSATLPAVQKNSDRLALLTHAMQVPEGYEALIESVLDDDLYAVLAGDESLFETLLDQALHGSEVGRMALVGAQDQASRAYPATILGCSRLLEHIEIKEPYRPHLEALLGNVYVADNLDQARRVCRALQQQQAGIKSSPDNQASSKQELPMSLPSVRVVTRTGCVLSSEGKAVVRRLSDTDKQNSALARRRALRRAREHEEACQLQYQNAQQEDDKSEEALRLAQTEALKYSEQLAHIKGEYHGLQSEVQHAQRQYKALESEHQHLIAEQQENQEFLEKAQPDADSLARDLAQVQAELTLNKEETAAIEQSLSPVQKEIVTLSDKVSEARLEVARLSERLSYTERMVTTREQEINSASQHDEQAQTRSVIARGSVQRADTLAEVMRVLAGKLGSIAARLENESHAAQHQARELHDRIAQATQKSRMVREESEHLTASLNEIRIEKGRLEVQVENGIKVIVEECATSLETALKREPLENRAEVEQRKQALERRIKNMGTINPDAAEEFQQVSERYEYLSAQLEDMRVARRALSRIVGVIDDRMRDDFERTFNQVNDNFSEIFSTLFPGGHAHLSFVDPDNLETTGIDVNAQPVGKRVKKMSLLSGGEKSMTAMALLFAVYRIRQTPFYILDEVEAALDDTNLRRLLAYLDTIRDTTQFIMITHQRRTMESADILYGVSMQADGVTKVISQKLDNAMRKEG